MTMTEPTYFSTYTDRKLSVYRTSGSDAVSQVAILEIDLDQPADVARATRALMDLVIEPAPVKTKRKARARTKTTGAPWKPSVNLIVLSWEKPETQTLNLQDILKLINERRGHHQPANDGSLRAVLNSMCTAKTPLIKRATGRNRWSLTPAGMERWHKLKHLPTEEERASE